MADNEQTTQQTTTGTTPTQETQPVQTADTGAETEKPIMTTAQLKERLAQQERATLKALGIEDAKTAKELLDEAKRIKESQLSEVEKQTKAIADAQRERDEAKARITELESAAKVKDFKATITAIATDAKAKYPADIVTAATTSADFAKWLEADEPNEKAIKAWVETYKAQRPDYFTNGSGNPGSPSNRNAGGSALPEAQEKMRRDLAAQIRGNF